MLPDQNALETDVGEHGEPLLLATRDGDLDAVLRLLESRIDPNAVDPVGETALFEAAASGVESVVAALLVHRADAGHESPSGMLASDLAVNPHVKTLLDLGQGLTVQPFARALALEQLSHPLRQQMRRYIESDDESALQVPLIESAGSEDSLTLAVRAGDLQLSMRLLESRADPNGHALSEAVAKSNHDLIAALLLHSADPALDTPMASSCDDSTKALLRLFDGRASPGDFEAAICGLGLDMRERVSERCPVARSGDPDLATLTHADQQFVMHPSISLTQDVIRHVQAGDAQGLIRALDGRADPNSVDELGETPLFEACASGSDNIIAALLLHSADPSCSSHSGMCAKDLASEPSSLALVDLFTVSAGVPRTNQGLALERLDPDMRAAVVSHLKEERFDDQVCEKAVLPETVQNPNNRDVSMHQSERLDQNILSFTVAKGESLMDAVQEGSWQHVERLIVARADPNLPDDVGETPLFEAVANSNPSLVAALLVHSADPSWTSVSGMVPLDLATDPGVTGLLKTFSGAPLDSSEEQVVEALSPRLRQAVELRISSHQAARDLKPDELCPDETRERCELRTFSAVQKAPTEADRCTREHVELRECDGSSPRPSSSSKDGFSLPQEGLRMEEQDGATSLSRVENRNVGLFTPPNVVPAGIFGEFTGVTEASTEALLDVFQGRNIVDRSKRDALALLDPFTVRCVLLAALQHLHTEHTVKLHNA
mmetsp:Transcript_2574/g.7677  ORF Transcript_2574/g.7677 Transcript_2574/m.7677 type:complete len:720 (-) Transcript_2574:203-2362(-)